MIAVTSNKMDKEGFRRGIEMVIDRLKDISQHYNEFCRQRGLPQPTEQQPLFAFGEISRGSDALLEDLLKLHKHPEGARTSKRVTPGGVVPEGIKSPANPPEGIGSEANVERPKRIRTRVARGGGKSGAGAALPAEPAVDEAHKDCPASAAPPDQSQLPPEPAVDETHPEAEAVPYQVLSYDGNSFSGQTLPFQWGGCYYVSYGLLAYGGASHIGYCGPCDPYSYGTNSRISYDNDGAWAYEGHYALEPNAYDGNFGTPDSSGCSTRDYGTVGSQSDVAAGIRPEAVRQYGPVDSTCLIRTLLAENDAESAANQALVPPAVPWPPTAPPGLAWVPLPDASEAPAPCHSVQKDFKDVSVIPEEQNPSDDEVSLKDVLDVEVSSYLYGEHCPEVS
jgi:hypothetical protein